MPPSASEQQRQLIISEVVGCLLPAFAIRYILSGRHKKRAPTRSKPQTCIAGESRDSVISSMRTHESRIEVAAGALAVGAMAIGALVIGALRSSR